MTSIAPTETSTTTQIYRIFIKATPQAIWDAITTPEWTQRFGYGLRDEYELRPGGKYRGHPNDGMIKMGMTVVPSSANFILFTGFPMKGRALFEELLQKAIIARSVDEYGLPDYLRITVGTRSENKAFLEILREVTKKS